MENRTIVIRHRLGRKGSKFFEGYLRSTLKNTVRKDAVFDVTDSSIKFEIGSSVNPSSVNTSQLK
jgi:hypothetical protein